jgi:hypothetical protein
MMRTLLTLFIFSVLSVPGAVMAQEKQGLSVTPPFAQMVLVPGDTYKSYVKVTNPNPFPLTVYATPVNFATGDETGYPKFIPLVDQEVDAASMAGWIEVSKEPFTIQPETSVDINYRILVPENAAPGGHFSALLIGTQPPIDEGSPAALRTSQVVSALFMARVEGDVVENGQIREFSVANWFTSSPQADFNLRFENNGTVYLQPQGDITIFNMWGTERGFIPVNHKTNFGNVLPNSIRKFSFSWEGTPSLTDIGRYKAVASLSYGIDSKRTVSRALYFWVIPVKATLITLGTLIAFIAFVLFSVRLYVRRALVMAGHVSTPPVRKTESDVRASSRRERLNRREITAPLREGVLDLRRSVQSGRTQAEKVSGLVGFFERYRTFFVASVIGLCGLGLIGWFIIDARTTERPYEVTLKNEGGTDTTISSEEVIHERKGGVGTSIPAEEAEARQSISIVNASGKPGTGADIALRIEQNGYRVLDISTDADGRDSSVIVFNAEHQDSATALSEQLGGVALSARPSGEEMEPGVLLIIGRDLAE